MTHAVILSVEKRHRNLTGAGTFNVTYKLLRRGRKKKTYMQVTAIDEMDAVMQMRTYLRDRGYTV